MRSMLILTLDDGAVNGDVKGLLIYDDEDRLTEAYLHEDLEIQQVPRVRAYPASIGPDANMDGVRKTIEALLESDPGIKKVTPHKIKTFGITEVVERFRKMDE